MKRDVWSDELARELGCVDSMALVRYCLNCDKPECDNCLWSKHGRRFALAESGAAS